MTYLSYEEHQKNLVHDIRCKAQGVGAVGRLLRYRRLTLSEGHTLWRRQVQSRNGETEVRAQWMYLAKFVQV